MTRGIENTVALIFTLEEIEKVLEWAENAAGPNYRGDLIWRFRGARRELIERNHLVELKQYFGNAKNLSELGDHLQCTWDELVAMVIKEKNK